MGKRKNKIIIILVVSIILLVAAGFIIKKIVDTVNYHKTYEYKFTKLGYDIDSAKILNKLNETNKDYILSIEKNDDILSIVKEKYFIEKNFKTYLDYFNSSEKVSNIKDAVSIVNVGANYDFYTNTKKADISKGNLMLVNKFYSLDNTYNSDNMKKVSVKYSYGENQMLTSETLEAFIDMFNAAKKENLTLIINSSFRSYEDQDEVYNYYKNVSGEIYANKIAAKPGFSEHQTGMAVDIQTYGSKASTFEEFEEFRWLQNNAHKYGFILRYPKDKEYLTGYEYESWHYRYVGVEAATYIHENDITFDEYYAYFIEKG